MTQDPVATAATIVGAFTAAVASVAAVGSWRSARSANSTALLLADIERDRRRSELVPHIDIYPHPLSNGQVRLTVSLVGPPSLEHLASVTITVKDDNKDHRSNLAGGPSDEKVAEQVWGPYAFTPGVNGASANGRTVAPFAFDLGDSRDFEMIPTRPPSWNQDAVWWAAEYGNARVRLSFRCESTDGMVWTVPVESRVWTQGASNGEKWKRENRGS